MRHLMRILCLAVLLGVSTAGVAPAATDVRPMLEEWVTDFRGDPVAETPVTFGLRVKEASATDWHVVVTGKKDAKGQWGAELRKGFPAEPCAYFITDVATLKKLHAGEIASLTAMGKAFSSDFAPLDFELTEGFQPEAGTIDHLIRLSFHFWARGFPETVRFGDLANTRVLHGANATLFYYQKGFRSGWFSVGKGQHVNQNEKSRTNSFPTLFIVTRGNLMARIGGVEKMLHEGETIYVGPDVSHEFWNDTDARAEGVIVMFGEGA